MISCLQCGHLHPVQVTDLPVTCQCGHVLEAKNIVHTGSIAQMQAEEDQRVLDILKGIATEHEPR